MNKLVERIALFPADALAAARASIRANGPSEQSLKDELQRIMVL